MEQNNEKKMTSYERKLQAREAAAKREKKKSILTIVSVVAIVGCLAALLIVVPLVKSKEQFKEYFRINDESVSELEFVFHKTNLINNNSQILQYMGMTSIEDLNTMVYDEESGMTWAEYFDERTAISLKENKALIADAKAKNVSLDVDAEYKKYMEQFKTEAETAGMTLDAYLTAYYGASEKHLKQIMKDNIAAILYSNHLYDLNEASDADAQAEYDSKKDQYDSVDYRVLPFMASVTEDSTEADVEAAMADAKAKAQEMLDKVNAGEDFETLCATYAQEDKRTEYADSETDLSLVTGASSTYAYDPYLEWLFDAERKDGDTTIYTDENNNVHYALLFEKRYMGDTVLASIKQDLTYNTVMDYIAEISESYTISDPADNLPTL